ncbi:MAG: glycerol-3-phosphate 1-O-acyltransferase PlsY [Acidimicrobiia bacterium]|nr:glycerol-3-phosphate 1-O-acyltransferase PlsY [Acidimicrobiia bacterium]
MEPATIPVLVAAYLVGSIDFGVIVPRLRGIDIYAVGSGNPGTSNVLRTMGKGAAAVVMLGDVAKGFVAAMVGDLVVGEAVGFAAGLVAVAGHCFPVWHRFKGGKGVATAGGAVYWLEPLLGLALMAVWAGLVGATKRASIASIALAVLLVPGVVLFGHRDWSVVWAAGIAGLVLARHHGNIRRLVRGSEHTVGGATA